MIGSIDMLASINSVAVASMASTGRRSATAPQAPRVTRRAPGAAGRSSRIRKQVARNDTKIAPPARKNVLRTPINPGNEPPINGPSNVPASVPVESMPSAHVARSRGVCVATSTTAPEE